MSDAGHQLNDNATELAFWYYLMSDAVIFALLFMTYVTMNQSFAGGPTGHELFDFGNAFFETIILLCSTLTCGFALSSAQVKSKILSLVWLMTTLLLGISFIAMEASEFRNLASMGAGPSRSGFLSAFFTLVGTHGLHVTVGIIWLTVMVVQICMKGLTVPVFSRLYRFSLFWHFLDLIWVGIFSIVYLPGVL